MNINTNLSAFISELLFMISTFLLGWSLYGEQMLPPDGELFWLFILFIVAYFLGKLFQLIRLPALIGMLIAGFVLRNVFSTSFKISSQTSAILRNTALTVILLRAGLGLDPKVLKKLSAVCFRLAFTPCLVETIVTSITSYFLLGLPLKWGLLLGFTLAAVSPAVVVPGMIHLTEHRLGTDKGIPTLVIAASSVDDILAITGFGVVIGIVFAPDSSIVLQLLKGPTEAVVGLFFGIAFGALLWYIPSSVNSEDEENLIENENNDKKRAFLMLLFGLVAVFLSRSLDWSGVGPLGALTLSFFAAINWRKKNYEAYVEDFFKILWIFCQPFLFGLIGAEVNLAALKLDLIGYSLIALFIGLIFRCITSMLVIYNANLNLNEKLFVALSWLPKATVQAAIGPVALDLARKHNDNQENIEFGTLVLNVAVLSILITAPIGALLIAITGPILLNKESINEGNNATINNDNMKNKREISTPTVVTDVVTHF